ncbi:hypothetical protein RD792_008030 [Penstemon davidsonii]|uniref:Uncharacterized protein n=1 Tax=Penstemon davidsonii TaxID=160366 RepID=A0ABR0D8Y0_9LAMI|nr:hypothetical protein RD792_008030 [Penstemon davidsonii]
MGAGGRMIRFQYSKPPFTLGEIKKAIPPHCFQKSILRSSFYLLRDLAVVFIFYYIATNYIEILPKPLCYVAWPLYWACQGCVLFGVWVIGHECGHHAFSDYQWLDDTLGLILHSALLTPYFSWKISHRRHHSNTSSLERDEVYVPKVKSQRGYYFDKYLDNVPCRLLRVIIRLTLGWYLYICFNMAGRKYDRFASHFYPLSPIYSDRERVQIVISDVGVLAALCGLYYLATVKGLAWVICVYGVPLLIVNGFMVLTTYLHHTHIAVPRYDSSEWDWLRGALATVDRDYGFLNTVFHNLTDTHVAHHLFSTMPHYHAMEATKAIKPILGDYYNFDATPILKAYWRESKECIYIEPGKGDSDKGHAAGLEPVKAWKEQCSPAWVEEPRPATARQTLSWRRRRPRFFNPGRRRGLEGV